MLFKTLTILIATFIPLAFVFSPYFHDGFFPTMDDIQVVRIEEMYKELVSGQFPARIAMDLGNGAGYMLFQYYAPAVYYIGALFHIIGTTLVISTKLTFLSGFIIAWLGIYLLLKERFEPIPVFFGSIIFFASSYIGYDAFHRGALAEFYALSILPITFFFILKAASRKSSLYFLGASFSIALLIITHNLTAIITSPFILVLTLILFRYNLKTGVGILLLGATLSSFYWLPVFLERNYIQINQIDFIINTYKNHFLTIPQLIGLQTISWGFVPPLLGINLFLGSLLGLLLIFFSGRFFFKKSTTDVFVKFAVISFFISLLMASTLSKPVWEILSPVLSFIQFPWRFLTLATFFGAISCAYLIQRIDNLLFKIVVGTLLVIPLFTLQYKYLRPLSYNFISKYTADDPCGSAGWSNEYFSVWTKKCLPKGHDLKPFNTESGNIAFEDVKIQKNGRSLEFMSLGSGEILMNKYYFPGWEVKIDDKTTPINPSLPYGLISFNVPEGAHKVSVNFYDTPARVLSNLLSLLGVIISLIIVFRGIRNNRTQAKKIIIDSFAFPLENSKKSS